MNNIREIIGAVFQSPMQGMSFPSYFSYVNGAGKITARSIMEVQAVILTILEAQEKRNEEYAANFKEIEAILEKLTASTPQPDKPLDLNAFIAPEPKDVPTCITCGKTFKSDLGLMGHSRTHNPSKS